MLEYIWGIQALKQNVSTEHAPELAELERQLLALLHRQRLNSQPQQHTDKQAAIWQRLEHMAMQYSEQGFAELCRAQREIGTTPARKEQSTMARDTVQPTSAQPLASTAQDHGMVLIPQYGCPEITAQLTIDELPTAYYNHLQRIIPALVTLHIDNTQQAHDITMSIFVRIPEYSHLHPRTVTVRAGAEQDVQFFPILRIDKVRRIQEKRRVPLQYDVKYTEPFQGKEITEIQYVDLLPFNTSILRQTTKAGEILDHRHYVSAWVTPNDPAISELLNKAAGYLKPGQYFTGYHQDEAEKTPTIREQVEAIFRAMQDVQIRYIRSKPFFGIRPEWDIQRVQLPAESIEVKIANCLEGSVLFASLLERVYIQPILVFCPGHAFVGWRTVQWLDSFDFLETTSIQDGDFEKAMDEAQKSFHKLQDEGYFSRDLGDKGGNARSIDIKACRAAGITPLE